MARHLLFGADIDPAHPLSIIQVSGGDGTTRHIIGGTVIDADHPLAVHDASGGDGVTVHANLTGLSADDHPQYQLRSEKAQANGYPSLGAGGLVPVAQLGSGTPTASKYLAGDGSWQTTPVVISAHSGLSGLTTGDDHTQYQLRTEKGVAGGYAGLSGSGYVPVAQLGSGSATSAKYLAGDGSWQTTPVVITAHSGLSGLSADDHPQYLLANGTRQATVFSVGGALPTGATVAVPIAPTANANYGLISLGSGPFDGTTSGFYVGNSNGTHIAINAASGYTGRMADWQVGGVRMFGVGRPTQASGASATLNAIDLPSFTVTVTGNTGIATAAGFNYTRLGIPTYSAASALTITNAATLAIEGAPSGAGAGPATITNAYPLWVQSGNTRLDGNLQFSTDVTVSRLAAASLRFGAAASATPAGYTIQVGESARGGTDTNTAGGNATYTSGIGTGTGAASSHIFQTPTVGSTGSVAQTLATRLTIATALITTAVPLTVTGANSGSVSSFQVGAGGDLVSVLLNTSGQRGLWLSGNHSLYVGQSTIGSTDGGTVIRSIGLGLRGDSGLIGWSAGTDPGASANFDVVLRRAGARNLGVGSTPSASPVANTITIGESSRAGTDSNVAGASGTIQPGAGTGTGSTVPLILNAPIQVASGSGAQTQREGIRVQAVGTAIGLSFYGVAAVARQVLATGAAKTVDDVIGALQNLGLVSQT